MQYFYENRYFKNQASVALNPLVSLFGRFVARSARISGTGQTDGRTDRQNDRPSTVTLAAHARRGLTTLLNRCTCTCLSVLKWMIMQILHKAVCVFTCVHVSMCVLLVQEVQCVCQYECEHTLPPLCGTLAAVQLTPSSGEQLTHAYTLMYMYMYMIKTKIL